MKIGIFGGTFDPPHIGHQILASEALLQIKLDKILWVLTPFPPHKKQQKITPVETRMKMVEFTLEGNCKFSLSTVDIDREPPHYAVDTVKLLKDLSPLDQFYYLMGMDSLNDLSQWHKPTDFIKFCDGIVVMNRVDESVELSADQSEFSELSGKINILDSPIIDISSSDIRRRIKEGLEYRYFVPQNVYKFIEEKQLYLD